MSMLVKIFDNKMDVRNTKNGLAYTVHADKMYSSAALLIADIDAAVECLSQAVERVKMPFMLIKPKYYIFPGRISGAELSQTEEHALKITGLRAGARDVVIVKNESDLDHVM